MASAGLVRFHCPTEGCKAWIEALPNSITSHECTFKKWVQFVPDPPTTSRPKLSPESQKMVQDSAAGTKVPAGRTIYRKKL